MKASLIITTVIVGLSLAGLFSAGYYQRNLAVEQSSALAMPATTEMLVDWDLRTIHQHATDTLLSRESAETTQQGFTRLSRRLGDLLEIYDIRYEVDMPAWWQPGGPASATYTMRARFESETATVRVNLVRQQGRWLIDGFDVQPPAIAS